MVKLDQRLKRELRISDSGADQIAEAPTGAGSFTVPFIQAANVAEPLVEAMQDVDDLHINEVEAGQVADPPAGAKHYFSQDELPEKYRKYFHQRFDIFSRYEEGIWMTEEAWMGVTPESVAEQIAFNIAQEVSPGKKYIIDAFAGVGGNAIAFARSGAWEKVFAIEKDKATMACAKHNAEIYGVKNKIHFYLGDCFKVLRNAYKGIGKDSVIFGSPPWGGVEYAQDEVFRVSLMQPYSLEKILGAFEPITKDCVLYLPRNADMSEIAELVSVKDTPAVQYCMNGFSKALVLYMGGEFVGLAEDN